MEIGIEPFGVGAGDLSMHMAVAQNYDEWLAENTAYCFRLSANITSTACDSTRALSEGECGDLRCKGCEGLHHQAERGAAQLHLVTSTAATDNAAELDPYTIALMSILDENAGSNEAEPETAEEEPDCSDAWIYEDDIDDELLKLFPELAGLIEDQEPVIDIDAEKASTRGYCRGREVQSSKRFAVYMGRCERCSGYMTSCFERYDDIKEDDCYKCVNCGWRISPAIHWNRLNLMSDRLFR